MDDDYMTYTREEYTNQKIFLTSFRKVLNQRGAEYLMNNVNNNTFVEHGSQELNGNYNDMMDIKVKLKQDIEDEDFPEPVKKDAITQLEIIDDIEQKLTNAGYQPLSGGRRKRKRTKRKRTKRRSNKRKQTKRRYNKKRQTKRKH